MPVEFPIYDEGPSGVFLSEFVLSVQKFLGEIVERRRDYQGRRLFSEELEEDMNAAWEDGREHFERIAAWAANLPQDRADASGLNGAQLRFKARVINWRKRIFEAIGGGAAFRKLLDAINVLLESIIDALIAAFPGHEAIGSLVKELKDYIGLATLD